MTLFLRACQWRLVSLFVEARRNSFYDGVDAVEFGVLRTIKDLTAHLEVSQRTARDWESAILSGFRVWRQLQAHSSGTIRGDLIARELDSAPGELQSLEGVSQKIKDVEKKLLEKLSAVEAKQATIDTRQLISTGIGGALLVALLALAAKLVFGWF